MVHRLPTREQFLEWYKIIYLENDLDLFKKTFEYYSDETNQKLPDFKYKYYTKTNGSTQRYRYDEFMYVINIIYKMYSKVKEAKTFKELIKKMYSITYYEMDKNISFGFKDPYFKNNQLKENELNLIDLFLISKWLGLKPNKEYEPYFNKAERLLKETKFTGQFN